MVGWIDGNGFTELLTVKSQVSRLFTQCLMVVCGLTYAAPLKSFAANSALPSAFNASALAILVVGSSSSIWVQQVFCELLVVLNGIPNVQWL